MVKDHMEFFAYANILVFLVFVSWFDLIERPNTIGYFSLAASVAAYLPYYFFTGREFKDALRFSFMFCLSLIAICHNINFLISNDYKGEYVVIDKLPAKGNAEYWRVQLQNGKGIDLYVYSPPSGGGDRIRLQKGLFSVHFGTSLDGV